MADYNKGDRSINRLLGINDADVAAHAAKRPTANSLSGTGFHFADLIAVNASSINVPRGKSMKEHLDAARECIEAEEPERDDMARAVAHLSHAMSFLGDTD